MIPKNTQPLDQNNESFRRIIFNAACENHKESLLKVIKGRLFFVVKACRQKDEIVAFSKRLTELPNAENIKVTPQMLGVIEWPYIHNQWDVHTKFDKIATHYEILSKLSSELIHVVGNATEHLEGCCELMDLSDISSNVKVVIDKAPWFMREGELLINLFRGDLRTASIAFTLGNKDGEKVAYVGAMQGIYGGFPVEEALEIFKLLTKDFYGLRPRSLLLEVLKALVKKLGISHMYAVSEQHRHHRHQYFGNDENTVFKNDYNSMWEEHGGVLDAVTGFYEIPVAPAIKDLAEIPSKKRGQYKRRYEIILSLDDRAKLGKSS
jgi:uncharacterized protein VirK/YbjX